LAQGGHPAPRRIRRGMGAAAMRLASSFLPTACAAKFAVSFAVSEAFPLLPLEAETLRLPQSAAMAALAAQPLVYIGASFFIGRFLDTAVVGTTDDPGGACGSGGRWRTCPASAAVALGLGITALGTAALGFATHPIALLAARATQGLGSAAAEVAAMVLAAGIFPQERLASAEGWLETATGLGYVVGMLAGGFLYGWRGGGIIGAPLAFGTGAAVCTLALVAWLLAAPGLASRAPSGSVDAEQVVEGAVAKDAWQRLGATGAVVFVFGTLMGVVYASLALQDERRFGFGPAGSASELMLIALAYIFFCPMAGRWCEGPAEVCRRCATGGLALGCGAYGLLALGTSPACQGLGLTLLGASEALVLIPIFPVMLDAAGGEGVAGTAAAVLNTSYAAGEAAGPLLSVPLVGSLGFAGAMAAQAAVMAGVAVALATTLAPQKPRQAWPAASNDYLKL